MAMFCQKRSFSKKHTVFSCWYFAKKPQCSHAHIFSKKRLFSQKHGALMLFFSNFSWKTPFYQMPYQVKNVNSVKTTLYGLWAKEVNRMPFFPIFHKKTTAFMPIFCHPTKPSLTLGLCHSGTDFFLFIYLLFEIDFCVPVVH